MKKVLGLDISSSVIGWAILDEKGNLIKYGNIKPLKKAKAEKLGHGYTFRMNDAYSKIISLCEEEKPDMIAIEDYSRKFSKGRSTANTIIVLATINEIVALACFHSLKIEPVKYPVVTMRSKVAKFFNEKIKSKDDVFPFITKKFNNFEITKTRYGNIRQEHYDESDAIFTALSYLIIKGFLKKEDR